jgi:hypothetical protein
MYIDMVMISILIAREYISHYRLFYLKKIYCSGTGFENNYCYLKMWQRDHLVETQDAMPSLMVFVIHLCIQCINKHSEKQQIL